MKKIRFIFCVIIIFSGSLKIAAQEIWTIGPMIHFNMGDGERTVSFAIEAAYWNLDHFYYSVDGGIEFDKKRFRLYSELQTGIGLLGVAAGPVFEVNKEKGSVHLGLQAGVWANYFLGVDYRMRWIGGEKFKCFGIYGKLPFATSGLESSGGGYGDWDDWD